MDLKFAPWLYYECCQVLEKAHLTTLCWSCEKGSGVVYWDHFGEASIEERPYHEGTSRVHMQLSLVLEKELKRSHP